MPIKMTIATVEGDIDNPVFELAERIDSRLKKFATEHLEFSYRIEEYIDLNKVVIKTLMLRENVN